MFSVTFWGVRGSHPVPGPHTLKYGGNTTCVAVRIDQSLIILDAGTGIIPLGKHLLAQHGERPITANLLFTHTHHDHIEGLAFFEPAYRPTTTLFVFGPKSLSLDLREILVHEMLPPYFPVTLEEMQATKLIKDVYDSEVILIEPVSSVPEVRRANEMSPPEAEGRIVVTILKAYNHPSGGVFVYSIVRKGKRMVFATDVEGYVGGDVRLVEFARGADVLIHDSQYLEEEYSASRGSRQGWGHSTVQMAVDTARRAGVKRLVLTHFDAGDTDEKVALKEAIAREQFPNTIAAYEGLELTL